MPNTETGSDHVFYIREKGNGRWLYYYIGPFPGVNIRFRQVAGGFAFYWVDDIKEASYSTTRAYAKRVADALAIVAGPGNREIVTAPIPVSAMHS